jgi:hypothetical protein
MTYIRKIVNFREYAAHFDIDIIFRAEISADCPQVYIMTINLYLSYLKLPSQLARALSQNIIAVISILFSGPSSKIQL